MMSGSHQMLRDTGSFQYPRSKASVMAKSASVVGWGPMPRKELERHSAEKPNSKMLAASEARARTMAQPPTPKAHSAMRVRHNQTPAEPEFCQSQPVIGSASHS